MFFWGGVLANEYHEEAEKLEPCVFSGLTLAAHHVPTKPLYHSHSINRTGGRNYDKKLMGQGKDRGDTSYCHGQNRLDCNLIYLVSNLIYCQLNSRIMRNKNKIKNAFPPPLPPSQAQLHSQLLYLLITEQHRKMENGGCSQFIMLCLCHFFFLTVFPAPSVLGSSFFPPVFAVGCVWARKVSSVCKWLGCL